MREIIKIASRKTALRQEKERSTENRLFSFKKGPAKAEPKRSQFFKRESTRFQPWDESGSYYVGTAGDVSLEAIRRYVESQKTKT